MQNIIVLLLVLSTAHAFYLPGVRPHEYKDGEKVDLKVNDVSSIKTYLPFRYYKFPFCQPPKIEDAAENLGEILSGNQIENSPYDIRMAQNKTCQLLCTRGNSDQDAKEWRGLIDRQYVVNWIVDNLPVATKINDYPIYEHGWPIGGVVRPGETHFLNNHARIILLYHQHEDGKRIVGAEIEPMSLSGPKCTPPRQPVETGANISWTYDVIWRHSENVWATRWDKYLNMNNLYSDTVHWYNIINSTLVILVLTAMVALVLMRTLKRDFSRYNRVPTDEEKAIEREETGWKLVHGDVFRAPQHPMLFAVCIGSGYQLFVMSFVTVTLAAMGFLSPSNRGSLMNAFVLSFVFMGAVAGYKASVTYKHLKGRSWHKLTLWTSFMFPGVVFILFFIINLVVWHEGSSSAIPFGTFCVLVSLWFCITW